MSILKKITTILFILCITGVSNAYPEAWGQINFSYISINDGLSQSTVFSIAQDKLGNMWFATYDGVNKYDGYTFTVYQHDENDPNSIANDISRIVMTDSKGRVWIGTRDGLSYYDEEKTSSRTSSSKKRQAPASQRHCGTFAGAAAYQHARRTDYVRHPRIPFCRRHIRHGNAQNGCIRPVQT